jgi:transcriptional regulator with XRE-family HTH domain
MSTDAILGKVPEITIAERLYTARTIAGYDKQELAALIGVSDATVLNYEKRDYTRKRRDKTLRDWADACDVNRSWLITGEPGPEGSGPGLRLVAGTGFEPVTSGLRPRHLGVAA